MAEVEGFLISWSDEGLCLLVAHSAVVVGHDNIDSVEHLDVAALPDGLQAVRVHYRDQLLPDGRQPFILATRDSEATVFDSPAYEARERRFLEEAGLLPAGAEPTAP